MPIDDEIESVSSHEPAAATDEALRTVWPSVIGTLSLIYAIGGMLCAIGLAASGLLTEAMMAMGGMKVQMPMIIKVINGAIGVLLLVAGVVLITGSIGTLRRKRSGPGVIRAWVLYRLILLVLGAVTTILTAPSQVQFQRSMLDAQQQRIDESGGGMTVNNATDEQIWRNMMLTMGVMSVLFAVYPIFVGFYLSRKKITTEVSEWP